MVVDRKVCMTTGQYGQNETARDAEAYNGDDESDQGHG